MAVLVANRHLTSTLPPFMATTGSNRKLPDSRASMW